MDDEDLIAEYYRNRARTKLARGNLLTIVMCMGDRGISLSNAADQPQQRRAFRIVEALLLAIDDDLIDRLNDEIPLE